MTVVNVHEAKTHLSKLLEKVEAGEEVVIARNGRPVALLSAIPAKRRKPGALKGRIKMRRDFDSPLPASVLAAFNGDAA